MSLARADAELLLEDLAPLDGNHLADPSREILRCAALFPVKVGSVGLDYPATVITNEEEAGFLEGARVKRTHLTLERNARIRKAFFKKNPTSVCDFCSMDTEERYPWTSEVLDVHHLLPLCSGGRTDSYGTVLDDLVANCPTCHRAVHRYYDVWLKENHRADFVDAQEAKMVYQEAKTHYSEMV